MSHFLHLENAHFWNLAESTKKVVIFYLLQDGAPVILTRSVINVLQKQYCFPLHQRCHHLFQTLELDFGIQLLIWLFLSWKMNQWASFGALRMSLSGTGRFVISPISDWRIGLRISNYLKYHQEDKTFPPPKEHFSWRFANCESSEGIADST